MCSETSPPRLSFANDTDLDREDRIRLGDNKSRGDSTLLDPEPDCDFEFSICSSGLDHESSLADELFADGMILPARHVVASKLRYESHRSLPPLPCPPPLSSDCTKKTREKGMVIEEKSESKSLWGFKRSSSLNCDIKRSLICSLPLLPRSNSTGSVPNPNKRSSTKDVNRQNQQKQFSKSISSSQKPPLRKNFGGSHNIQSHGGRISPILNVPPPTAALFGLGSFLRSGKQKKNIK